MIGGMAESHAYMGEGLATALVFFEDLQQIREAKQRHCILICNSPPYNFPIMECETYAGRTVDQVANLFQEVLYIFLVNHLQKYVILKLNVYVYFLERNFTLNIIS